MARITGLNDRFEQNWQNIINNYSDVVSSPGTHIPSAAAGFTYTWLMWGPSLQMAATGATDDCLSLGIYGCGDEANSVHVAITRQMRQELSNSGMFCMHCTVTGRLCNPLYYVERERMRFDRLSRAFVDRIYYSYRSSLDYIIDLERMDYPRQNGRHGYFSAYIWAMFNFCPSSTSGHRADDFRPADTVVMFEHANLADAGNYRFLCECLVGKIERFMAQTPVRDGSYKYCCAMNSDVDGMIRKAFDEGRFPAYVSLGHFEVAAVFEALDSHFNIGNYKVIAPDRYPDVIRFHYQCCGAERMDELCSLLEDDSVAVVGAEDDEGSLVAVCVMRSADGDAADYVAVMPQAAVEHSHLEEFCRYTLCSRQSAGE